MVSYCLVIDFEGTLRAHGSGCFWPYWLMSEVVSASDQARKSGFDPCFEGTLIFQDPLEHPPVPANNGVRLDNKNNISQAQPQEPV